VRVLVCVSCLMTGCFYVDPIEVHPTVSLSPPEGSLQVYRGGHLQVTAHLDHPDRFEWAAFACADRFGDHCSAAPFAQPTGSSIADFEVPVWTADDESALTQSIHVTVTAHDDRGALAGGEPSIKYMVDDAPPALVLASSPAPHYTVGGPIDLFAKYGDPDDDLAAVLVAWQVIAPDPMASLVPLPSIDGEDGTRTQVMELVPGVTGAWSIQAAATDPLGATTLQQLQFNVEPDYPPCLAQWQPIVPPEGAALPITEPTLFQIERVVDDLDSYPRSSSDPRFGTTAFAWSLRVGDDPARQPVAGVTGNAVALDPAAFAPGQIVELRVEAYDRSHTALGCPDAVASCGSPAPPVCLQRQTWRVEIR